MSSPIEELGGRWDAQASRDLPLQTKLAEAKKATGRDAEEWTPGQGHRVRRLGGKWLCVVCGDGWRDWPSAECTGPAGVAL